MTLFQAPLLTDGASHPAQEFRQMIRDLSRGAEGITTGTDLKVSALGTPGAAVQIGDGSGIIIGRANAFQGSYSACNIGSVTKSIASTGGSVRSDMVVLRVLDPQYEGSLNPAVDPIVFFDVISNVGSTATTVPGGYTAIPLARIDIPVSTSTITAGMVKDIRQLANPRRDRNLYFQFPASLSTEIGPSPAAYAYFSTAAGWALPVPAWASIAKIKVDVAQLRYSTNVFFGQIRATFGASLSTQDVILDDNITSGIRRATVVFGDTLTIPDSYRSTSQTLRVQASCSGGATGKVSVDASTTLIADVEWVEAPR